jgi:hypothetical protein
MPHGATTPMPVTTTRRRLMVDDPFGRTDGAGAAGTAR